MPRRMLAALAALAIAFSSLAAVVAMRPGAVGVPGGAGDPAAQASADHGESGATPEGSTPGAPGAPSDPGATPGSVVQPAIGGASSPMSDHLSGDVYGFLPYWEMDGTIESALDWNALSTLALFSVGARANGSLTTGAAGYKAITGERGRRIIATANQRGVRTEVTFTSFGGAKNADFFANVEAQAATITALRDLVRDVGAKGVNVDVEEIADAWYPAYGDFCRRLRAALRLDNPAATLTVSTATDRDGARLGRTAVDAGADRVFLMAYVYRWSGSTPGAIAPMDFRGNPLHLDLPSSIAVYADEGVPTDRLILGLPLYGMTWPTEGPDLGAGDTGKGESSIPRRNLALLGELAAAGSIAYDPQESVEWFARQDATSGTWTQTFYDSPRSLEPKLALAVDRGLAGIGFWALGYERGLPGYWDLVKRVYGPPKLLTVRVPARTRVREVAVDVAVRAGSRPLAGIQLSADGKTWGSLLTVPPLPDGAGADALRVGIRWTVPGTGDGTTTVHVRAVDEVGTVSAVRRARIVVDTTGPTIPKPLTLAWGRAKGAWRVRWAAAADGAGVAGYRVRLKVGARAWVIVRAQTAGQGVFLAGVRRGASFRVQVRAVDGLGNVGPARVVRHP